MDVVAFDGIDALSDGIKLGLHAAFLSPGLPHRHIMANTSMQFSERLLYLCTGQIIAYFTMPLPFYCLNSQIIEKAHSNTCPNTHIHIIAGKRLWHTLLQKGICQVILKYIMFL